jgi:CTP synthase (UTP-ammonia lyase)
VVSQSAAVRIGVIGDRHERFVAQDTIEPALRDSAARVGAHVEVDWHATSSLVGAGEELLSAADAIWCAPGSPYLSLDGALEGIRAARQSKIAFLGTCAGFQHGVIEFARNVLGIDEARHGEYGEGSGPLLIDELLCSLVGQELDIELADEATRSLFGSTRAREQYYCRFGLNESYVGALAHAGLVVAGTDARDGSTRILRYADAPFGYLTLFVPQANSSPERPHPLITGFVAAALAARGTTSSP